MTTIFFLRHAAHDNVGGFLAGRSPGVVLGPDGLAQAARLAARMRRERPGAVYASPQARTRQTAEAVAAAVGTGPVVVEPALDEIDFGRWSGLTFDILGEDPEWRRWNAVRSLARTPAGDTMFAVQARVVGLVGTLAAKSGDGAVALVTHADVIKAAVAFYLGLSLDAWPRFDVAPASVTTLQLDDWSARIVGLNERVD